MARRIMTVAEAANYLRVSRITIYRLLADGRLPGFKVGASWRLDCGEIDQWAGSRQAEAGEDPTLCAQAQRPQALPSGADPRTGDRGA